MISPLIKKLGVNKTAVLVITLFVFICLFFNYLFLSPASAVYFLDVGQGDSEFLILPDGVNILIDGGPPNGKALEEISNILPFTDRYIDLVIMTHPELDHFGGLIDVLERYKTGAFLYNGRKGTSLALSELEEKVNNNVDQRVILEKGDKIRYKNYVIEIISPEKDEYLKNLNDGSLVFKLNTGNSTFLFTGDIGSVVEKDLIGNLGNIDVLKVAHHGSKYSSSNNFLNITKPKVSIIEVGENSHGHPAEEILDKLKSINSQVYRTDQDGTIKVVTQDNSIKVFVAKK
jgi:competence protein ComEC